MQKFDNFAYFVLDHDRHAMTTAQYSFTGYQDNEGTIQAIYYGRKNNDGDDEPHRFKFDRAHRTIRILKTKTDIKGTNVAEFLRNFPECAGSPNGHYKERDGKKVQGGIFYKEIVEGKDAEDAIAAKTTKIKAENIALNLKGVELAQMAALYECYTVGDNAELMQKHRVLEAAGADPTSFLEAYNAPDRAAKSLIKDAVNSRVITKHGEIYMLEDITLGASLDLAVSKLLSDDDLFDTIKSAIKYNK